MASPADWATTPTLAEALVSAEHWTVATVTLLLVGLTVFAHYEALERLNHAMPRWRLRPRLRILALIAAIIALHVAEIWIFGIGLYAVALHPELGHIAGSEPLRLLDAVYLSATTYTTIGYGDLAPVGPLRLIMGTEALTGFVLLTWSASFTYLEMRRYWRGR